jgi:hypothetical protein
MTGLKKRGDCDDIITDRVLGKTWFAGDKNWPAEFW